MNFSHYQIAELVNGLQPPVNYVIVPMSWIDIDEDNKFITKYMPDPYGEDDEKLLKDFVDNRIYPPPDDWVTYEFISLAEACTCD